MKIQDNIDNNYPFLIRELSKEDGGGFLVTFPDLPGCMSDGDTVEEAIKNSREAMVEWIKARKEWGKEIPVPTPPMDHEDFSGKFVQRIPKSLHAQLARRAERESVSMNQLVTSFIVAGLTSATWKDGTQVYTTESAVAAMKNSIVVQAGQITLQAHTGNPSESNESLLQKIDGATEDSLLEIIEATYKKILKRNDTSNLKWFCPTTGQISLSPKKKE